VAEQLEHALLRDVRVLVLVHEDVAEGRERVLLQQLDGSALEAAVVGQPGSLEVCAVLLVDGGELVLGRVQVLVAEGGEGERFLDEPARGGEAEVAVCCERLAHGALPLDRARDADVSGEPVGEAVEGGDRKGDVAAPDAI